MAYKIIYFLLAFRIDCGAQEIQCNIKNFLSDIYSRHERTGKVQIPWKFPVL